MRARLLIPLLLALPLLADQPPIKARNVTIVDAFGDRVTWIEHVDPRAVNDELIALARTNDSSTVRGKALFWLALVAGDKAAGTLRDAVDNDPESKVKE